MHRQINKMAEAIPLTRISAAECAFAMFHGWISRFGVPAVITSDRGAQFISSLWSAICSLLNIKHKTTTAFHPQSNGMVERFHRQLKNSLRARLASSSWFEHVRIAYISQRRLRHLRIRSCLRLWFDPPKSISESSRSSNKPILWRPEKLNV